MAGRAHVLLGVEVTLRPYQSASVDAALSFLRSSLTPCLIDAAPAAGKSHIIAAVAQRLHEISGGKRLLALAPSRELVLQNYGKLIEAGARASIFPASAGAKSTRHPLVYGTPKTVANAMSRFTRGDYCGVVIDEAHGVTPTIIAIVNEMRAANPNLRVLGLTGTPFRLGTGYIYREGPDGRLHGEDVCRDPYFAKCVYRVSPREMLDQGYITPMTIGAIHANAYDTSGVHLRPNGQLDDASVEAAFVGHGRVTATIVADVVHQAQTRAGGVMLFAATRQHAAEIMASLPPGNSVMVTGDMPPQDRKAAVAAYKSHTKRYVVSVGTLTTGFDSPWTEIIAVLRYTESAALLQQIMGRAWRLHDGKTDALLLDYAGNVERHFPDGDIYAPQIRAGKPVEAGGVIQATCPACAYENAFSANKETLGYKLDAAGYCLDTWGQRIETDYGPMPGHHGRRCNGMVAAEGRGNYKRCAYRWTSKPCPACDAPNDIAARYCATCKAEIVDPNEKLAADFVAMKRDPTQPQCDEIIAMEAKESVSSKGNPTVRVDVTTPHRRFSLWLQPQGRHPQAQREWRIYERAIQAEETPATISYVKALDSSFYRLLAFDEPADAVEEAVRHVVSA